MELWAALSPFCCKTQEIKIHLSGQKWPGGCHCLKWPWQSPKCSGRFAGWQRSEVSLLRVLRSESWRIYWSLGGLSASPPALGVAVLCQSWRFLSISTNKGWYFLSVAMSTELWFQWDEQNEGNFGCTRSIFTPSPSQLLSHLGITLLAERCLNQDHNSQSFRCPQGMCQVLSLFETQEEAGKLCLYFSLVFTRMCWVFPCFRLAFLLNSDLSLHSKSPAMRPICKWVQI